MSTPPPPRPPPDLGTIRTLLEYADWSNDRLLAAAGPLSDEQLDRDMQIGPGTLRRTLIHIHNGEYVWLRRWRGEAETPWPSESDKLSVDEIRKRFEANRRERETFLARLSAERANLGRVQPYRDSKGTLYRASLGDMLLQGALHSKHHQAQAVNIVRRVGGEWPELDYMYRVRVKSEE
jgi:uncharacterized damage-inducible protein DinB